MKERCGAPLLGLAKSIYYFQVAQFRHEFMTSRTDCAETLQLPALDYNVCLFVFFFSRQIEEKFIIQAGVYER